MYEYHANLNPLGRLIHLSIVLWAHSLDNSVCLLEIVKYVDGVGQCRFETSAHRLESAVSRCAHPRQLNFQIEEQFQIQTSKYLQKLEPKLVSHRAAKSWLTTSFPTKKKLVHRNQSKLMQYRDYASVWPQYGIKIRLIAFFEASHPQNMPSGAFLIPYLT